MPKTGIISGLPTPSQWGELFLPQSHDGALLLAIVQTMEKLLEMCKGIRSSLTVPFEFVFSSFSSCPRRRESLEAQGEPVTSGFRLATERQVREQVYTINGGKWGGHCEHCVSFVSLAVKKED